jgi:carboxyl-terminal processing protease
MSSLCRVSSRSRCVAAVVLLALAAMPAAQATSRAEPREAFVAGALFDAVVKALSATYYDKAFRREALPQLVASYRDRAERAADLAEERVVVDALLRHVPASHLALYSKATYDHLMAELARTDAPTFGFEVEQFAGQFFVTGLLEGGPAAIAGLSRGDRVVSVDGVPLGGSPRLDRSSDDAHLPDRPRHYLLGAAGDELRLTVQRAAGAPTSEVVVPCVEYSAWRAAQASVAVREVDGVRVGYVHYWFIHIGGVTKHFKEALNGQLADCAAYVVDLRGRGGDGMAAQALVTAIGKLDKPCVALIDRGTRSAKEVIAYELRARESATLVGEHTARAVIPATFKNVGRHDVLMYPTFTLGDYTKKIELQGVAPHVAVEDRLPFAAGADPILAAGLRVAVDSAGR